MFSYVAYQVKGPSVDPYEMLCHVRHTLNQLIKTNKRPACVRSRIRYRSREARAILQVHQIVHRCAEIGR